MNSRAGLLAVLAAAAAVSTCACGRAGTPRGATGGADARSPAAPVAVEAAPVPARPAAIETPATARPAAIETPATAAPPAIEAPSLRSSGRQRARLLPGATRRRARPRMPRGRTVRGALRRALLAGAIDRERHKVHRRAWWRAQRAARRLRGRGRAELVAVLRSVDRIAAAGLLTTSRIELAMLTVRRNREFWSTHTLPAAGSRYGFERDPLVYQYYPGQGLHVQPLANFGTANALWRTCTTEARRRGWRCRKRSLRKLLDRLLALGARRDGYLAFEYLVPFGGGSPPWVSGMTQATAAQALARAADELGERRYRKAALDALGAFERRPPAGVAVPAAGGSHYLMYSFNPNLRILNGFLQSVRGLHDVAELTGSRRARRLFRRADRVATDTLPAYDTGAWSLYADGGEETSLHYHRLTTDFAGGLCRVTRQARYCGTHRRFARYLIEPPRVQLAVARRARTGRRLAVSVTVSKRSSVALSARRRGATVLARRVTLPRGTHAISWTPHMAGSHHIAIEATGVNGRRTTLSRAVAIEKPQPKRRGKGKGRRRDGQVPAPIAKRRPSAPAQERAFSWRRPVPAAPAATP